MKFRVKTIILLFFAFILLEGGGRLYGLSPSGVYFHYYGYAEQKQYYENKLKIEFKGSVENDYPYFWSENGIKKIKVNPVSGKYEYSRFFNIVKSEFEKIPEEVIKVNVREIYGVDSIYFDGVFAGGSYDPEGKKVFVTLRTSSGDILPERFIKSVFHHEMSSIFLHSYGFDERLWRNSFSSGFRYRSEENPFYFILLNKGEVDKVSDEELFSRGLVDQYAETGLENDFNTYAEAIFTEPRKMKKLIAQYPVIKRKYEVFKAFYLSIDQDFSSVFEEIDG